MQSIRQCITRLASCSRFTNKLDLLSGATKTTCVLPYRNFHQSLINYEEKNFKFLTHNEKIFPPQQPGEERRPGFVCHMRENIKYSPKKMWYIACFVRGMSVDEAVKQLSFLHQKGAAIAKDVILEAQRLAVEEHNIEFKSNLWVAESFASKGVVVKGIRRHARKRMGLVHYRHCHYYVRLEEGKPPKNYYMPEPKTGEQMLDDWKKQMRMRKIINSL